MPTEVVVALRVAAIKLEWLLQKAYKRKMAFILNVMPFEGSLPAPTDFITNCSTESAIHWLSDHLEFLELQLIEESAANGKITENT